MTALVVVLVALKIAALVWFIRRRRSHVEGSILPSPRFDVERTREHIRARMRDA